MKRNYTIGSLNDQTLIRELDTLQFTLNTRVHPSKRKTVSNLKKLSSEFPTVDKFVHCDYLLTLPRFPLMSISYQENYAREIAEILHYSNQDPTIRGIVIHTDSPFKKEMLEEMFFDPIVSKETAFYYAKKYFQSPAFIDTDHIINLLGSSFLESTCGSLSQSVNLWYEIATNYMNFYIREAYQKISRTSVDDQPPLGKLYIENTTKVPLKESGNVPGRVYHNVFLSELMHPYAGVCLDTEHAFASGDVNFWEMDRLQLFELSTKNNLYVHLNTIPRGVTPFSYKDLHSSTTIFECSYYEKDSYLKLTDTMDRLNIPWMREVKKDTALREIESLIS